MPIETIFKHNYHSHTYHSPCGKGESFPLSMLQVAAEAGIETLAFTDHFADHPPYGFQEYEHCGMEMIEVTREEVCGQKTGVRVLFGCEADILAPGVESITPESARQLDFVMVSASHFHFITHRDELSSRQKAELFMQYLEHAFSLDFVHVIAHPFWTPGEGMGLTSEFMATITDEELRALAEKAVQQRIAMGVNNTALGYYPDYQVAMKRFYTIYLRAGGRLTYGSDAHSLDRLRSNPDTVAAIHYLGLQPADFLLPDELINKDW